jgi:hypothetical protein
MHVPRSSNTRSTRCWNSLWRDAWTSASRGVRRSTKNFTGCPLRARQTSHFDFHQPDASAGIAAASEQKIKLLPQPNLCAAVRIQRCTWSSLPADAHVAPRRHRPRRARCATNPRRSPAAANRKFPSPSPTPFIQGPAFIADFKKDFDFVEQLVNHNYSGGRFRDRPESTPESQSRPILSPDRSLGSVIQPTDANCPTNTRKNMLGVARRDSAVHQANSFLS